MSAIGARGGARRAPQQRMPTQDKIKPQRDAYQPPSNVPPGWLFIHCSEPAAQIQVRLGKHPFLPTAGFGGWEIVDRPSQVGMTIPSSTAPYQYSGSIMFDGWRGMISQERRIARLMLMAHGDDNSDPGIISLIGIPRLPADDWVIEDLSFDEDSVMRHPRTMEIIRVEVTLTIREYVSPQYLRVTKNATKQPKGGYTFVKVAKGDTPHTLAIHYKCSVRDIKELNPKIKPPITKANQNLKDGITLRVPIPNSKAQKNKKSRTKSHG